jgi:precorrin-8X/cobalt-precorrin-8 methylmutase
MSRLNHPIVEQSFAIIDREIGEHFFSLEEYAIIRRIIHTTADFEFSRLFRSSPGAIEIAISALQNRVPIITDVTMVKQGIATLINKTFQNPIVTCIEQATVADAGKTRTETGLLKCFDRFPEGIYVIGNAPTALLALCDLVQNSTVAPSVVIGVPVGFVSVVESKESLARSDVPRIWIEGRKGGSTVAAAIVNALLVLAHESRD